MASELLGENTTGNVIPIRRASERFRRWVSPQVLIRVGELSKVLGYSERTIYRWARSGPLEHRFPQPIQIRGVNHWKAFEVEDWLNGLK